MRPCTPSGVMLLLEEAGVTLQGALAVVVGRSNLFGKPMAQMLLGANATVVMSLSRTSDEVAPIASAITPVPGGVGPMTIACLLRNTVLATAA